MKSRKSILHLSILRDIRGSFGRFFAIFAIIALGVGFFSGVRITTPAMVHTFDQFFSEHSFFDLKLVSTIGWDEKDVTAAAKQPQVLSAEGAIQYDVILATPEGEDAVVKAHSLTESINTLQVTEGRLPQEENEVLLDSKNRFSFQLGDTISFSDTNTSSTLKHFNRREYTIVGFAYSPLYINFERGTTSLGKGTVSGFIFLTEEAFRDRDYTEIYVDLDLPGEIYSDEYQKALDGLRPDWEDFLPRQAEKRLRRVALEPDHLLLTFWSLLSSGDISSPDTYLMDRSTNVGYACFESDSRIVEQIARVFPIFFILVAALVCMTTMTRMIEEQRSEIGTLKALGYSGRDIAMKYTVYSGSATLLGCIIGYIGGIIIFPGVIWIAYHLLYIRLPLQYIFDPALALISFVVAVICSIGITLLSCRYELSENAAGLMRPRAPKPGKRVFLEYIPFIWDHMKFFHKVSARNILRYKGRFFMMVLGISGCTALLLTGFGLRDSIEGFAEIQFGEIQAADLELNFREDPSLGIPEDLAKQLAEDNAEYTAYRSGSRDLLYGTREKGVQVLIPEGSSFTGSFHLNEEDGDPLEVPGQGEILLSIGVARSCGLSVGDTVQLRGDDLRSVTLKVSGIFMNHVQNYVIASPEDLPGQPNALYVTYPEGTDIYQAQTRLAQCSSVSYLNVIEATRDRFVNMLKSIDYIVIVVILSAAGLAFVVLFNLTNINITERIREIATIKVLGFYAGETAEYIFRENFVLTLIGTLAGLGLGVLLHGFVMAQIKVDKIYFSTTLRPLSFLFGFLLTLLFTLLVSLVMRGKLDRINMAESLKSVE